MTQEQFLRSWNELKQYVPSRWTKITTEDVQLINGNQATFNTVIEKHYGAMKEDVSNWAHRWYCHWSGSYEGYQAASAVAAKP